MATFARKMIMHPRTREVGGTNQALLSDWVLVYVTEGDETQVFLSMAPWCNKYTYFGDSDHNEGFTMNQEPDMYFLPEIKRLRFSRDQHGTGYLKGE